MDIQNIVSQMRSSAQAIGALVERCSEEQARWKPDAASWSMLEVVNHLLDEEREDFRPRIDVALHRGGEGWAPIDPQGWVTARGYNQRELEPSMQGFLTARRDSLEWLLGLGEEEWAKEHQAPFGAVRAGDLLAAIGAVIAMVAGGRGAQQAVKDVFAALGTNVLILQNNAQRTMGASAGAGGGASLTWDDLRAIEAEITTARWIAPVLESRGAQIVPEQSNWNTAITGTTAKWFKIRSWAAAEGAVFDEDTGDSNAKVAVIGKTVATQLFSGQSPIGQTVRISGQPYEVIGVLAAKGQGPRGDNDDTIVIPIKTYQQKLEKGLAKYIRGSIMISTYDESQAEKTISQVTALLRDRHKLDGNAEDDFRIRNPAEFAKAQQDSTERISTLVAIVAAVSLFVGGIGVMNIMLGCAHQSHPGDERMAGRAKGIHAR